MDKCDHGLAAFEDGNLAISQKVRLCATDKYTTHRGCGKISRFAAADAEIMLGKSLSRVFQIVATAVSFGVFGGGLLLMAWIVVPYIKMTSRTAEIRRERTRDAVDRSMRIFVGFMASTQAMRYTIEGQENIPEVGAYVVAANHPTLIDAPFLLGVFPRILCVAKRSLARNWIFGTIIRAAEYQTNDDPIVMMDQVISRLRSGEAVLIFPEGTRSENGQHRRTKRGAAALAVRGDCPVVPVIARCDPPALSRTHPWYRGTDRVVQMSYRIHPPIMPNSSLSRRDATRDLHARLEKFFASELTDGPNSESATEAVSEPTLRNALRQ